jgi:PQQ-dependent dehydrogenase (methanol/ethanol family)
MAALFAALLVGNSALAQAPQQAPQPKPVPGVAGSAGEAAPPVGAAAPRKESFQNLPVTQNVGITDAMMLDADRSEGWILHGRTYDNQRFSPLSDINLSNVQKLRPTAIIQTGVAKNFENTAIAVDGVLYLETADNHVMAYDAITGKQLWSYIPSLSYSNLCCGQLSRGVAVAYGKVFVGQLDGHVVALDARSGKVIWKTDHAQTLPQPYHFYSFTMAPIAFNGLVLVGNAGAEWPTRGFLQALDANSGKLVWRFNTTAAPNEPGGKSWAGESWKYGGGSVWNTPAIDVKNNLILFAVGNPNPDLDGSSRKGDNAYTNSIVALDSRTGKLRWWYQEVPHDVWDLDACAPVVLFDTVDDKGKPVAAAAHAGKTGILYIVNRLTGKLIRKSPPFVDVSANFMTPLGPEPKTIWPANHGGAMWQPPAYSPQTKYLYQLGVNEAHDYIVNKPLPETYKPGTPIRGQYSGGDMPLNMKVFTPNGTFSAIDVATGKIAWQVKSDRPYFSGVLATAGGLVFTGEMNGDFVAHDARTGKKAWSFPLGAGVCTPPITYAVKGVQYVAVGAGGCHGGEIFMQNEGKGIFGEVFAIFALPDKT